jgi:Transposase DDE domain
VPDRLAERPVGRNATGRVSEATFPFLDDTGRVRQLRRVTIRLDRPTRGGDRTIVLITNLPPRVSALTVAAAYRARWTIERLFRRLTDWLHWEQPGLGQPRAALFAFALALVASNLLAVVEASLAAVWGRPFLDELSDAALVDEVGQLWRGLPVALPARRWAFVRRLSAADLADLLRAVAGHADPARFRKAVRGPKKPRRTPNCTNHRHRSTFRVLRAAKTTR